MTFWDQHVCLPLEPGADITHLHRYADAGATLVSVNVGYAPHDRVASEAIIAAWTAGIGDDERLTLARTTADVDAAAAAGRLAVVFDLEDANPLDGEAAAIGWFHELGVRTLLPTYNYRNAAGSGCMDAHDEGLTSYGRAVVTEMNTVGMVVDATHCGERTALDMCRVSRAPVIYSHSGAKNVWDCERNITDEQIRACADTGGVIGIPSIGIFLGRNEATTEAMVRHIEHVCTVVGIEHVGVGSDFTFEFDDVARELERHPHLFPASFTQYGPIRQVEAEAFLGLATLLRSHGFSSEEVHAVCYANFRRVAQEVWD